MNNRDHGLFKSLRIGLLAPILMAMLLVGCASQEATVQTPAETEKQEQAAAEVAKAEEAKKPGFTAPEIKKKEEERVERERREKAAVVLPPPDINADQLPPPRPQLDTGPDLFDAQLVLSEKNLDDASSDGLPPDVREKLSVLQDQSFSNASELVVALRGGVGYNISEDTLEKVLRNTMEISLDDSSAAPAGNVDLVEAEERQKEVAMTTAQPGSMGAAGFGVVHFDNDRSTIKPEFMETIRANAKQLLDKPDLQVVVEGHCDERGTTEYNLALGQRRASAVYDALIAEGVSASQLDTVSYGEERPVASGQGEEAWAQNRRAMITLK